MSARKIRKLAILTIQIVLFSYCVEKMQIFNADECFVKAMYYLNEYQIKFDKQISIGCHSNTSLIGIQNFIILAITPNLS